jgi:hypothetical protein
MTSTQVYVLRKLTSEVDLRQRAENTRKDLTQIYRLVQNLYSIRIDIDVGRDIEILFDRSKVKSE